MFPSPNQVDSHLQARNSGRIREEWRLHLRWRFPKKSNAADRTANPEVLKIKERGDDYFLHITDARPDTGGLSGAKARRKQSAGEKSIPMLPDAVVAYVDSTVAIPILTSYALRKRRQEAETAV